MASTIYQLPTISADTNAGTGAISGASESFSRAGTVFGELRKSILDEEQRKIENDFKQRQFEENIRQFGETLGFHRDQLTETNRHNLAAEALDKARNDITAQHYRWAHEDAQAATRAHRASNALLQEERADKLMRSRAGMLFAQYTQANPDQKLAIAKSVAATGDKSPITNYLLTAMNDDYKNPPGSEEDKQMRILQFRASLGDEKAADSFMKYQDKLTERAITANKNFNDFVAKNQEAALKNADRVSRYQRTNIRSEEPLYRKALLNILSPEERAKVKNLYVGLDNAIQASYDNEGSTSRWFERPFGGPGDALNFNGSTDWGTTDSGKIASMEDDEISAFGGHVADNIFLNNSRLSPTKKQQYIAELIRMRNELNQ